MRLSNLLTHFWGIYRQRHGYILALNIKPMPLGCKSNAA
ncbi:hypothetical protein D050_1069 [Vibrio parahaemolyticus VPCR-2009]|nr:hypothetical protein D019_3246 [Vibrio parahaemolyticus VP2007-095]EXJ36050.1 hypothetical protein D050_1069 [Vibrio parahaemolyticus VPCR-2009]